MTRKYEIVYIFDSAVEETAIETSLERHHALLKSADNPEPIEKLNHWGKRTLAYPIKHCEVGHYTVVELKTDGALLTEFERSIKLDESIIRYLLVLNEGEVPVIVPPREDRDGDDDDDREPRRRPDRDTREERK